MDRQTEQHIAAWTARRGDETRAMLASGRDKELPGHAFTGDGKCILCGRVGKHDDRATAPGGRLEQPT